MALRRVTADQKILPIIRELQLCPRGSLVRGMLEVLVVEGREGWFIEVSEVVEEHGGCG